MRKRLSPGSPSLTTIPPARHEPAVEAVRDATEEVVLEVGEERARERLAPRSRGPVAEAPDERQQLLVEGQRVLLGRLRPGGAGLRAGGVARRTGRSSPRACRLAASAAAIRARAVRARASKRSRTSEWPGADRVGPSQRLEGAVVEAVPRQLVRDAEQDGQRLLAVVGQDQEVGEAEALGEGRGAALDLRAQDRHGLGVAPLRHELVDGRWPVRAGEPVEDHGRARGLSYEGRLAVAMKGVLRSSDELAVGAERDQAGPRAHLLEHAAGRLGQGAPSPTRSASLFAASFTRIRSPTPVRETPTRGVQ